MRPVHIISLIVIIFLFSSMITGCKHAAPKECKTDHLKYMYFCDGGEKVRIFKDKTDFEVITIEDDVVHKCKKDSDTPPCDIVKDTRYCPRINYCEEPGWQRA